MLSNSNILAQMERFEQLLGPEDARIFNRWFMGPSLWQGNCEAMKTLINETDLQDYCLHVVQRVLGLSDETLAYYFEGEPCGKY